MSDQSEKPEAAVQGDAQVSTGGRRRKILVGGVVAGTLLSTALAVHAMGGHGFKHHRPMKAMMSMIEMVDTDQSGTISRQEIDNLRAEKFTGNDGDNSGELTLEEFQSMWMEIARPVMVDHFQFLDHDGDGRVTREEFDRPINRVVTVLDRDGDGEITMEEVRSRRGGHRGKHDA